MNSSLALAAGWALVHCLWQGAIIAAALAAFILTTKSPRIRYAAASVALILTLVAFGFTLFTQLPEITGSSTPVIQQFPRAPWPQALTNVSASPSIIALIPWLSPLWIAGVLIFYVRQLAGWVAVTRLRRRGVCAPSSDWQLTLAGLGRKLKITRPVQLLESCFVEAPLVLGHLRPVILVPIGLLTNLPASQVEAILLHELAHVRRHDYLMNLLQRFVEGLLFYHPAVWWISHVIRTERENCCDDIAVAVTGDAHLYAAALNILEVNRQQEPALAATGGNLVKRIQRLLNPKNSGATWAPFLATLVLMATATMALSAWPAPADESPYMKWVNQDVVYIISTEERTAYLKLTTDPEREAFIEQFWLRRDPTPGTPKNEYKEEHYRRIAYCNERFADDHPGWNTDRGRMYIIYGPPDEIESHPSGTATTLPKEVWMYKYIEGLGTRVFLTFIKDQGAYRLAPGSIQ